MSSNVKGIKTIWATNKNNNPMDEWVLAEYKLFGGPHEKSVAAAVITTCYC